MEMVTAHKKGAPDERSPWVLTTSRGGFNVLVRPSETNSSRSPVLGQAMNPSRDSRNTDASPLWAVHVTYTHHRRGESGRWIGGAEHRLRLQGQFQMPDLRAYTTQGEGPSLTSSALGGRGGLPSNRPSNLG